MAQSHAVNKQTGFKFGLSCFQCVTLGKCTWSHEIEIRHSLVRMTDILLFKLPFRIVEGKNLIVLKFNCCVGQSKQVLLHYKQPIMSAIYTRVYSYAMLMWSQGILTEGAESFHLWVLCPMEWRRYDPCHFNIFIYLFFENFIHVSNVLWPYPPTPLSTNFFQNVFPLQYTPCSLISSSFSPCNLLKLASSVCIHYISMTKTCHTTSPSTKRPEGAAWLCC